MTVKCQDTCLSYLNQFPALILSKLTVGYLMKLCHGTLRPVLHLRGPRGTAE